MTKIPKYQLRKLSIVYEVMDEKTEILNIYHTSRDSNEVLL